MTELGEFVTGPDGRPRFADSHNNSSYNVHIYFGIYIEK